MKHTILAIVLLLALTIFLVLSSCFVCTACREMAIAAFQNAALARAAFEKYEPALSLFVHNKLLEGAETALFEYETAEYGSAEYYKAQNTFVFYCREMSEDMSPSIDSVF